MGVPSNHPFSWDFPLYTNHFGYPHLCKPPFLWPRKNLLTPDFKWRRLPRSHILPLIGSSATGHRLAYRACSARACGIDHGLVDGFPQFTISPSTTTWQSLNMFWRDMSWTNEALHVILKSFCCPVWTDVTDYWWTMQRSSCCLLMNLKYCDVSSEKVLAVNLGFLSLDVFWNRGTPSNHPFKWDVPL